jgi:ABC-type tungstate transport system permease subunit
MKFAILFAAGAACLATAAIADNAVLVQSTTSTKNAGLYDYICQWSKPIPESR